MENEKTLKKELAKAVKAQDWNLVAKISASLESIKNSNKQFITTSRTTKPKQKPIPPKEEVEIEQIVSKKIATPRQIDVDKIKRVGNQWFDDKTEARSKIDDPKRKLNKKKPVPRNRPKFKFINIKCASCGRKYEIHPGLVEGKEHYECDNCIQRRRTS